MKNLQETDLEFDKDIVFRFAEKSDIPEIMGFIRDNWRSNHIFANDRAFFNYEFVHNGEVCFCLMEDNGVLSGILGYIPYEYDLQRDVFTVMWMVLKQKEIFGGIGLLKFLIENGRCHNIYSIGLKEDTRAIYTYFGYKVECLKHFYRIADRLDYNVACIVDKKIISVQKNDETLFVRISEKDYAQSNIDEGLFHHPYKSRKYVLHRYFNHPKYNYKVYQIYRDTIKQNTYVIAREEKYGNSKILHIVDVLGDVSGLQDTADEFQKLIEADEYEYISFYELGIPDNIMESAGFIELKKNDTNIIPNYFHPFEQTNTDIYAFYETGVTPILFKGDGDQDRP